MKTLLPDPTLRPIVIVDDSEDDVFLLRYRLREGGINNPVLTFNCARKAHSYFADFAGDQLRPGLFFTDIRMPDSCGLELISSIRSDPDWDNMRIVVLTSSNHPDDLARALAVRVDGYLIKFPPPHILADFLTNGPWFTVPIRMGDHSKELSHASSAGTDRSEKSIAVTD